MMLDQLVSGLPQAARTSSRDRQDASKRDGEGSTDTFENLVARADQHARRDASHEADDKAPTGEGKAKASTDSESRIRVTIDFSEAVSVPSDKNDAAADTPRELTMRTARGCFSRENVQEDPDMPAKHGDAGQKVGHIPHEAVRGELRSRVKADAKDIQSEHIRELRDEKPSRRAEHAANAPGEGLSRDDQPASPIASSLSPTDELGLLLGVASTSGAAVAGDRKPIGTDRIETGRKGDDKTAPATHDRTVSVAHADPVIASIDLPHRNESRDADTGASRGDAVRVIGANGAGRATDIALSRSSDASKDADKPAAGKLDTAVVLEARRYLGFSPDSNATTLANAARSDPFWSAALDASRLTDLGGLADTMREVNTLKLQMNPENLGNMVASLKLRGEELSVEVRVDSIEAYRHLSADHDDLVKALQDQGFSIDKVTVQLNATDRTDTSADRDMARQGQAQREGQEGQSNRNDGRQNGQRQWESSRQMADSARGNGSADGDRAGNIYL